ncbi:DUF4391 domain-containing protein [Bacillus anthracis]|uniref:DUF4391 domain-containing protein n=1 Tax=Bacillus cereus group TaxID=86661 RepID=UPI000A30162C|nr:MULTISPECIES: DUF4391 domain-containing protein [Bacillus cereus group]MDA1777973.1 DUF4391 domain-containing protein [Bacillus cereus group sp. BY9-3LC]MDA1810466.1 DUF4391 domain-containing protein [Bacillus cereus]MDR4408955.1 DUF4391 domain-containing protein [Bacillus anthracis]SMD70602.1 hypothetical protein BACERE00184_00957 [Bacillus cereus]BCC56120.1 hypothetical protein BCJMU07_5470 [Bacillus cereus]
MREWIINRLEIPARTVLNRKIPKKAFFTQGDFSTSEKEMFTSQVEGIYLLSVMNQQSTNIPIYQDDEFHYAEVVWIYVELRTVKNINKIIGAVHQSIPNPVVLIMGSSEGQVLLSTSHKRLNKNDKTKVVVEQPTITDWFKPKEEDSVYFKLLNALVVSNLSFENLHSIYEDIHQWIRCEVLIQLVGAMPTNADKREEAVSILSDVQKRRKEIGQLQQDQKGQLDFGAKMDIHMKIKRQEQQINSQLLQIKELC